MAAIPSVGPVPRRLRNRGLSTALSGVSWISLDNSAALRRRRLARARRVPRNLFVESWAAMTSAFATAQYDEVPPTRGA